MARLRRQRPFRSNGMRIVFTAPRFHTNQVQAVKALQDRGCEVAYLVLYEGPTEDHTVLKPVVLGDGIIFRATRACLSWTKRLHPDDERDFRIDWGCPPVVRFWRELKRLDPDAVVVRLAALPFAVLALVFARIRRARVVIYSQQPLFGPKRRRFSAGLICRLCHACWITPVEGDPEHYDAWSSRVFYVPFVAEPGARAVTPGVSPARILSIGKFEPRKKLDVMVDAFEMIRRDRQVRLTIVGECSSPKHRTVMEALELQIQTLGLQELVEVRVNVPYEEVQALYADHDMFVLPSSREAAAVSLLEAMSHGLPVICSDSNGTKNYIEQGGNGYVFRSNDAEDLALAIRRIVDTPGCIERMGSRSISLVESRHSPEGYHRVLMMAIGGACEAKYA